MNIIDLLIKDHVKVKGLLDKLINGSHGSSTQHESLLKELEKELKMHTQVENEIFYPALEEEPETKEMVKHSYKEHKLIDEMLAEIVSFKGNAKEQIGKIEKLKQALEHHISEEEETLFPNTKKIIVASELDKMAGAAKTLKQTME